ncbi:TPA: hypothetical protein N0F65_005521 [Lagenidium giganteum]|uniref:Uncharacterized protein n=1 Tax=Lagenidium giganteum TaxID=4803 RepID=A0AAV2YHX5_9STRA|nr:TPA: hypothetical protein N0F65_005521 [Lagenidium giganteum]
MGVHPPHLPIHLSRKKTYEKSHHDSAPEPEPLPLEVVELKRKLLEVHPSKCMRFSLSHMRRVAIPPVEIPESLNAPRAISAVVAGKNVPFTKHMWDNRKKRSHHLDMIDEYVVLYR